MKKTIIIISIALVIFLGHKLQGKENQRVQITEQTTESQLNREVTQKDQLEKTCYQWISEEQPAQSIRTITYSSFEDEVEGTIVTGEDSWVPAEKDSNVAIFRGYINTDEETLSVVATVTGEGGTYQEERFYKLNNEDIGIGYIPNEQPILHEDGVYRYSATEGIQFLETVPQVDCENLVTKEEVTASQSKTVSVFNPETESYREVTIDDTFSAIKSRDKLTNLNIGLIFGNAHSCSINGGEAMITAESTYLYTESTPNESCELTINLTKEEVILSDRANSCSFNCGARGTFNGITLAR